MGALQVLHIGPDGGLCLQSWPPSLLHRASSFPDPGPPRLLMSSGSFRLRMGALLRVFERPGRLRSLAITRPRPHPRATRSFQFRSGRPDPPRALPLLLVSTWYHPRRSWWSAALEHNGKSCSHVRVWSACKTEGRCNYHSSVTLKIWGHYNYCIYTSFNYIGVFSW